MRVSASIYSIVVFPSINACQLSGKIAILSHFAPWRASTTLVCINCATGVHETMRRSVTWLLCVALKSDLPEMKCCLQVSESPSKIQHLKNVKHIILTLFQQHLCCRCWLKPLNKQIKHHNICIFPLCPQVVDIWSYLILHHVPSVISLLFSFQGYNSCPSKTP